MDSTQIDRLARSLAADSIRSTTAAGSGHPTSSMSSAHITATLLSRHLRFDVERPDDPANDRLVLSKGHAAPLLYAALAAVGAIGHDRLRHLRQAGSPLEGHPVPGLPLIDVATGSLGQGLSNGMGMAMALRRLGSPARVWVVLGDSEMAEGSVWEAMELAAHHRVTNLVGIVDMNRLGQRGPTMYGRDATAYLDRARAFGWEAIPADGHDPASLDDAFARAVSFDRPTLVVANTVKGWGVSFLADEEGRHGKALSADEAERALAELGVDGPVRVTPAAPPAFDRPPMAPGEVVRPSFEEPVATRDAFGLALAAHARSDPRIVVLDGEVSNSTRTARVEDEAPGRFVECYIAEQAMVGAAAGIDAMGLRPVVSTFAAFLTRAHDFFRMAAIGHARMLVNGSHAGVSIGEDGPSQMGLDDLSMFRSIPGTTVLYPADGTATAALLALGLDQPGITYLRTTREDTPALYPPDTSFRVGGSHVLRSSTGDVATVVGAGVTVFEALEAADALEADGLPVRVVDAYSVQPIDRDTLRRAMEETRRVIVAEDHAVAGGLGEAVLSALADVPDGIVHLLGVRDLPGSATPDRQRQLAGISAGEIAGTVRELIARDALRLDSGAGG